MPVGDRFIVFLIYTREDVPLRLDEAFLTSHADCHIHLITTERVTFSNGCRARSAAALVPHRFKTTSDINVESVRRIIRRVVGNSSRPFEIITLSESAVDMTGKIKLELGLVDRDFSRFVDKDKMKREASLAGVATPRYVLFDRDRFLENRQSYTTDVVDRVGLPCFAKPIDLYGAMESKKINSLEELESWASTCMRRDLTFEIDEFIDGTVYQCDSIVCDGVSEFCQVSVSSRPWSEIYHGHNVGLRTVRSEDTTTRRVKAVAERINRHFMRGMSGVTCLEVFVREDEIVFLEIAYRPAGAGIASSPYFTRSSNVRMNESHILAQVNPRWRPRALFMNYVGWVIIPLPPRGGKLREITVPPVSCQIETYWNVEIDKNITENDGINSYAGAVLLWSRDYQELTEAYESILDKCALHVEAGT
ncbi:ATP-grasp domain-containing protein [Ferruginivarius sediminum]|uniref:ATP-grasp domain-containing protein n=1 Tax=Ferruginivarius sediminum TaxID=2661937 RepID=A0A369TCG5_9PROT|nr:hypothetical protein [Ferruginivarius sediminum]RDD62999.1 hypothetical protein DRB17_04285 [Ferruginivarius sediminum]